MERDELKELHYITPIRNVPSILRHGILSHVRIRELQHESVAMPTIQDRRAVIRVPGGRHLHEYANLYVCGRNPMLYKRQTQHEQLCVLSVSTKVLDLAGVVITDQNAASDYTQFRRAPGGLSIVDRDLTFAEYWTSPDQIDYWQRKAAKCAELLVPDRVEPRFIREAYVSCDQAKANLEALNTGLPAQINRHLFFM